MARFLTVERFVVLVGEDEAIQIAGDGLWGAAAGAQIVPGKIEPEIAFTDELVTGYVMARHGWLAALAPADMPNLLQGIAADIVRYRLRDKEGNNGQVTETVEARYKDAIRQLEAIQAGKLDLVRDQADGADLDPAELHGSSQAQPVVTGPAPQHGSILKGYM